MVPVQCKMARVALGLGVRELAELAKVAPATISRLEAGENLHPRTLDAIRAALEAAGVVFLEPGESADGGPGVRLRRDKQDNAAASVIPIENLSAENDE
ncbi:MAG: helix-turn-helix domain-containing protein [Methylocystis sp.]|uniref:helix-turn-helix domain-containing protein n=1 Tax=Methylocystis sp. TaxID=1911079 RepID=UPI003DA3BDA2